MELANPSLDSRQRAQSMPLSPKENKRIQGSNQLSFSEAPIKNDQIPSSPVPSILLEGEALDVDPDIPEIHRVVIAGDVDRLKELIKSGESVNTPDLEGWPPLHAAIRSKNYECAQLLIKHGASDFFERQKEEYTTRQNLSARLQKGRLFSF